MDLPNLFTKNQSDSLNLFLTLVLTDRSVQSGLWRVSDQKIILSNQSGVHYFGTDKERLIQIDASLLDLGKEADATDAVLLGLEPNWVDEEGILEERKKELKEIADSLSLNAVGFVLTTEVLHQYLIQKNVHLSSVVLYVGAGFIELILIRQGEKVKTLSVGRSEDIASDLKEALARLDQKSNSQGKHLPPNLLLASTSVDQEKLEQYRQQLLEQDWQQELQFIQTPVIDIVNQDKLLQIITQEGGKAVAQDRGLLPPSEASSSQESTQDLTQKQEQPEDTQEATSFGVPVGDNFQTAGAFEEPQQKDDSQEEELAVAADSTPMKQDQKKQDEQGIFKKKNLAINPFKGKKKDSGPLQPDTAIAKNKKSPKSLKIKFIAALGILAGIIVSAVIYFFYLNNNYQAQVVIQPAVIALSKDAVITLDPQVEQTDAENRVLKARVLQKEVSGTNSMDTTGVKLVGEKAAGTVTLFNKTESEKSFEAGTELSSGEIKFELTSDVTLPPATTEENPSGDGATLEYGQIEAEITALEIGAEGNLSEDTAFQIGDFSENTYQAKAAEDLSGGSSREIRVVAEEDQQELLVSLRQRLLKQARDEFESESGDGQYITPTDVYEIISQNYSAEIGDEVEQLTLDLTLQAQGITYTAEDIRLLAKDVLESEIPPNYRLLEESSDFLSQPPEENGETDLITVQMQLTGNAKAEVDEGQIKQEVADLLIAEAESKLNSQETIEKAGISLVPQFSQWIFKTMPNQERILVEIN